MKARHRGKKARTEEPRARRIGVVIAISAVIIIVVVLGYTLLLPAQPALVSVGMTAPDFRLPILGSQGISDEELQLSSLRGKIVFLEFMESWCEACQTMAEPIDSLRRVYEPKDVVWISVAGSYRGATVESTLEFMRTYDTNWTYLFDSDNAVFSRYGVEGTPTFFILDRDGTVASRLQGVVATDSFISALDPLVGG
jgi:peroxiredoxin